MKLSRKKMFVLALLTSFLSLGFSLGNDGQNEAMITDGDRPFVEKCYRSISSIQTSSNENSSSEATDKNEKIDNGKIEQDFEKENVDLEYPVNPSSIGVTGSVSGTLYWKDYDGGVHPLKGTKLKITISGSWWSSEQYTDDNGYYKFSYNDIWYIGSGIPTLTVYSQNESITVSESSGSTYSTTFSHSGSSGDWHVNETFSSSDNAFWKALMISQIGRNYSEYAKTLNNNEYLPMCTIRYPSGLNFSYYNGNGTIYLDAIEPVVGQPDSYASWDMIGHEYAHHVQKHFGFLSNYSGKHYVERNIVDEYTKANNYKATEEIKKKGLQMAWNEAWPTYWSTIAQTHFEDEIKSIKTVADSIYSANNIKDYDLDEYNPNKSQGEADELAIQRILYKLNSKTIDEYDKFSINESTIWSLVKANKLLYFYQFMEGLYELGYNTNDLGKLLKQYNVIGGEMTIKHNYLDGEPTLTWSTQSGSDAIKMNKFDIHFLDSDGNEVAKQYNIKAETDSSTCSYTISSSTWSSIYKATGNYFYAFFVAYQDSFFETGGYYSELFAFPKPTSFSDTKIQIKPNEWGFIGRYYYQDEIEADESVRYSTLEKGGMTISTDRLRCGYIRKSYLVLSPRKEGAGEAYFEMTFGQAVYSVQWSLCLWGGDEMLDGHVGIEARYVGGGWSEIADLTDDVKYLPLRGEGIHRSFYYFPSGCSGIRVTAKASAEGSSNKGRLCMDDFVLGISANQKDNTDYGISSYPKTEA